MVRLYQGYLEHKKSLTAKTETKERHNGPLGRHRRALLSFRLTKFVLSPASKPTKQKPKPLLSNNVWQDRPDRHLASGRSARQASAAPALHGTNRNCYAGLECIYI